MPVIKQFGAESILKANAPQTHRSIISDSYQHSVPTGLKLSSRAAACGKAIIVGEHAVVYGAQAIAMPIKNLKLEIDFETHIGDGDSSRGGSLNKKVPESLRRVIEDAFQYLGKKQNLYDVQCRSEILIGAGLGSSAALCVGLMRALAKLFEIKIPVQHLAQFATQLESHFHGKSSGLDTAVVAMEKVIAFNKGKLPTPIDVHKDAKERVRFALIDSETRASTSTMVKLAAPYFQGYDGHKRLEYFNQLASMVKRGLESSIIDDIAFAMNEAGRMLKDAKVVTENLSNIIEKVSSLGALAAKPTGAGGGGFILALLDPNRPNQLSEIRSAFAGHRVLEVGLN